MVRKKTLPDFSINDLLEANSALEELGALERLESTIKNALNEKIKEAKNEADAAILPIAARKKLLATALESYEALNKGELFKNKKSVDLSFGVLTYRTSREVAPINSKVTWGLVLGKLKELGLVAAIRRKEEVNKEVLETWPDEKLEKVGVKWKIKEIFDFKTKQETPGLSRVA